MTCSTKFDQLLVNLLDRCSSNDMQRAFFLRKARRIAKFITDVMAEQDPIFRPVFEDLRKCAIYESDSFMDMADISPFLRFEAPFGIKLKFDSLFSNVVLFRTAARHDIVSRGYIGSEHFDKYVKNHLCMAVKKLKELRISRKFHYALEYRYKFDRLHVIEAKAVDKSHNITFEFKLAFKFSHSRHPCNYLPRTKRGHKKRFDWLALRQTYDRLGYGIFVPMMQFIQGRKRVQLRNMLRLLRPYFNGSIGMLRNLLVIAVETDGINFGKLPLGLMLLRVLEKKIEFMEKIVLNRIMADEEPNVTDWVNVHAQFLMLVERVKELRQRDELHEWDIFDVFDD